MILSTRTYLMQLECAEAYKDMSDQTFRKDAGKPPASLLPGQALLEVAKVLDFGAKKYSPSGWRSGGQWSRHMNSTMRHLLWYIAGQRLDPETGLSHLAHAACDILFLLDYEVTGVGEDDIWKAEPKK